MAPRKPKTEYPHPIAKVVCYLTPYMAWRLLPKIELKEELETLSEFFRTHCVSTAKTHKKLVWYQKQLVRLEKVLSDEIELPEVNFSRIEPIHEVVEGATEILTGQKSNENIISRLHIHIALLSRQLDQKFERVHLNPDEIPRRRQLPERNRVTRIHTEHYQT
jgi:hypothetical protein